MTDKNQQRQRRSNQGDEASEAMIFEGCTQSQLCKVFRMDRRTVADKIAESPVRPCGTRSGYPIYHIHEVAPYLVKPLYDVETYIKKMHHNDLPPLLSKEFWNGKKARQEYELRNGDLWRTDQIFQSVGEVFKDLRMGILLFRDTVERETLMTRAQREKLTAMTDGLLHNLADSLQEKFNGGKATEEEDDVL